MNLFSNVLAVSAILSIALTGCHAAGKRDKSPSPIHLEAEDAQFGSNTVETSIPGYTGKGYVGHFEHEGDKIVWTIPAAHSGIYQVTIHYASPGAEKGYDLVANGTKYGGMFSPTGNAFAAHDGGKIELTDGANTFGIEKGWGWYYIDSVDLTPVKVDGRIKKPSDALSDPKATPAARKLMRYLVQQYGKHTLTGQVNADDTEYIRANTGKTPAIMGGDLIDYSPSRVAHGSNSSESERLIEAAHAGQIVTLLWHWNAPTDLVDKENDTTADGKPINHAWYRGFYTDSTTFDVEKALADPKSEDYALILRDIDTIAVQLKKFSDAGVPVLWRPLHESSGGWFWWGAKGPEPFKKLWLLMYDRLTNLHNLHNLIWVYSGGEKQEWYPGDKYADVVGIDMYPSDTGDPLSSTWETLTTQYGGRKPLALCEFGGVPDIDKMKRFGVRWAYFASWGGDLGPKKVTKETLKRIYTSPLALNKDGLPTDISK